MLIKCAAQFHVVPPSPNRLFNSRVFELSLSCWSLCRAHQLWNKLCGYTTGKVSSFEFLLHF